MPEPRVTERQKRALAQQAGGCCEYCRSQARFATDPFSAEHILPRSLSGPTTPENLAYSCQGCNNFKHAKIEGIDPGSGEIAPLFHPRRQRWRDHFVWNVDFTLIIGITPTGRSTVETLRLNRESLVNLRRILRAVGEHPPEEPGDAG
jgi:hypothetical protein